MISLYTGNKKAVLTEEITETENTEMWLKDSIVCCTNLQRSSQAGQQTKVLIRTILRRNRDRFNPIGDRCFVLKLNIYRNNKTVGLGY